MHFLDSIRRTNVFAKHILLYEHLLQTSLGHSKSVLMLFSSKILDPITKIFSKVKHSYT